MTWNACGLHLLVLRHHGPYKIYDISRPLSFFNHSIFILSLSFVVTISNLE